MVQLESINIQRMNEDHKYHSWQEFFSYWEKEAKNLRNEMLSPEACGLIMLSFHRL